jgi:chemotaxis family two-component system sensor kinase Cph1
VSEERKDTASDLTSCDREPIHIPGAIQPHGVLLALHEPELTITQVSENVADHFGRRVEDVLTRPLASLLDDASVAEVRVALGHHGSDVNPLRLAGCGKHWTGVVHRHEGAVIVEFERACDAAAEQDVQRALRRVLTGLQSVDSLPELCQGIVEQVRYMTGFERVVLYRFDEEGHGHVDAEAKEAALDPYLGLHYPASDIPSQARQLYLRNWTRLIPDARYTPSRLRPALRSDTGVPLDLSFAVLRSVSPIHLEYLANMGVRAAMSISLVVRDRLWGLISCLNHTQPRHIEYALSSACEVLGRLASLQIAALEQREAAESRAARRGTQSVLTDAMRDSENLLEGLLARPAELLSLVDATGAAVASAGTCLTCGDTPDRTLIAALVEWLDARESGQPFATGSLPALFPAATRANEVASGLLTFALPGTPTRRLLWFRPEMPSTVHWGGDPRKPVETDDRMRIHPRRSFALWKEEVRLRSSPWNASAIEAAQDLRRSAVEVDLEHQLVREQLAVRARDDLVAVVSHDLKNPLGVIQMQIALLLNVFGRDDEPSNRLRASAERIQRSVDRMNALIHDLLDLAKIEAGRFVVRCQPEASDDMLEEALIVLRPLAETKRIKITHELRGAARVQADRERIFQVLSNLIGNAIKFTPEGGRIDVRTRREDGEVLFTVADTGPGIPEEQLSNVFNRYWQEHRASREGSGLGLYIAKGIVEAHGGRIWAENRPGSGAQFKFALRAS